MNSELKVATVILNAALDLTGSLKVLPLGKVNLLEKTALHATEKESNKALSAVIKAPYLIKPNEEELSVFVDQTVEAAAKKLQHQGCKNTVLSLGKRCT